MNYVDKLQYGSLLDHLQFMANDYLGPSGQSMSAQLINRLKREYLLEAVKEIQELRAEVLRTNREIARLEQTACMRGQQ
jgi:hypothetical protein